MIIKRICLLILMMVSTAMAVGLDGRTVILVVSEHRKGDALVKNIQRALFLQRDNLGLSKEEMPIVFMGFLDSDAERKYFDRLGFKAKDAPVICVTEWGNPARFGPKRVNGAIARTASEANVARLVDSFLHKTGRDHLRLRRIGGELVYPDSGLPINPPPTTPPSTPPVTPPPSGGVAGRIDIVKVRFEASGKPLFMTNAAVRLHNPGGQTLRNITVRFYAKPIDAKEWLLITEEKMDKLPAGYFATRDFVGDTRKINIVDAEQNSVRCHYKVEVEQGGHTIVEEGVFVPSEAPVSYSPAGAILAF